MRLNGKRIIPNNEEVVVTDLPVGGCRRFDTLECLSDVPFRGRMEVVYWKWTDDTLKDHKVDNINCKGDECESPYIGWWSKNGIYKNKKEKRYYGAVRLGRRFENATLGLFTCHFERDSDTPVSVWIGE